MPTYDYECDACGHAFELFQQMKDAVKKKCPECKKLKLRRLFGAGSAVPLYAGALLTGQRSLRGALHNPWLAGKAWFDSRVGCLLFYFTFL